MPEDKAGLSPPRDSAALGPAVRARHVLERLDKSECMRLLSAGRIGHLVCNSRYGPVVLPVGYEMHGGSIVFSTYQAIFTEEDLRTGIADAGYRVAVEVGQVDPEAREGWIVLVHGTAHHLDTEAERASIAGIGLKPWTESEPEHFIQVDPVRIAGQRIRRVRAA